MSKQATPDNNSNEERQYRYRVECGKYTTMSETYHKRGPLNVNLHVLGVPHIIWCPECHRYEKVIDVQPLPTRKEAARRSCGSSGRSSFFK